MGRRSEKVACGPPALTLNGNGASPIVLVCDHASNRMPKGLGTLGLTAAQRLMHIAWDPGALSLSLALSRMLDAPLVQSTFSRLVIDCNRYPDAHDLIPQQSEHVVIPGNADVSVEERERRMETLHRPYHAEISRQLALRDARGMESVLVFMHSFTPVFHGVLRPWPIGLIHGRRTGFTRALYEALQAEPVEGPVGWNLPYPAQEGVYYSLDTHADATGRDATLIEMRHDLILFPAQVARWADLLARSLDTSVRTLRGTGRTRSSVAG